MILRSCLLLITIILGACSALDKNVESRDSQEAENQQANVLIVNSNAELTRYKNAQDGFVETRNSNVSLLDLGNEQEPVEALLDALNGKSYQAIYGIGGKAVAALDYIAPSKPVVFSSVLNWQTYASNENFYGIANDMSPQVQLTWFRYIFPEMKTLAVIYSQQNKPMIEAALPVAERLGLRLLALELDDVSEIEQTIKRISSQTNQLWLISDGLVLPSMEGVERLFSLAQQYGLSVLGYDEVFIEMGALLVVDSDRSTSGRQAAHLMNNVLNKSGRRESIHYPAGSRIVLNKQALERSALKVNKRALDSISEIR